MKLGTYFLARTTILKISTAQRITTIPSLPQSETRDDTSISSEKSPSTFPAPITKQRNHLAILQFNGLSPKNSGKKRKKEHRIRRDCVFPVQKTNDISTKFPPAQQYKKNRTYFLSKSMLKTQS